MTRILGAFAAAAVLTVAIAGPAVAQEQAGAAGPAPQGPVPVFGQEAPPFIIDDKIRIDSYEEDEGSWSKAFEAMIRDLDGNKQRRHRDNVGFVPARRYMMKNERDLPALVLGKSGVVIQGEERRTTIIDGSEAENYEAIFAWRNPGDDWANPRRRIQFIHGGGFRDISGVKSKGHGVYLNRPGGEGLVLRDIGIMGCAGDGLRVDGKAAASTPLALRGPFTIFSCNRALSINGKILTAALIGYISGDGHGEAFLHFNGGGAITQLGGKTEVLWGNQTARIIHVERWQEGMLVIFPLHVMFRKQSGRESEQTGRPDAIVRIDGFNPKKAGIAILGMTVRNRGIGCPNYQGLVVNGQEIEPCTAVWNKPILLGTAKEAPAAFWQGFAQTFTATPAASE